MKNKYILAILLIALIFGATVLFKEKSMPPRSKGAIFIEKIREENKSGFDSLQNAITSENNLHSLITKNIYTGDFATAYTLMDSIPISKRFYFEHFYKGLIYEKQKRIEEAIKEYSILINKDPSPVVLGKRAEGYIWQKRFNDALNDYKKAYSINYDYSLQVASTFELVNKKDSALKYYLIYSEHYPNQTNVQTRIKHLTVN